MYFRFSEEENAMIRKAAMEYKNLSAFLLSAARDAIRYRRIIEQAKMLHTENAGANISAMEVRVK